MAEKKKTVEDIIADYQKFNHKKGKSFKERMKKFEEYHDPENIHPLQFLHHAHYVVFGHPTKTKEFPGAYNEAYKVLDKHAADDGDKIEDEDKLAEILETYTDSFLQKAIGDGYKDYLAHAKDLKLDKKDLREMKGQLLAKYHLDDEGRGINILSESNIKALKGRKKVHLITQLQQIGERTKRGYASHLQQAAIDGLIGEDDHLELAKYITPIFQERGLKHDKPHVMRSVNEQAAHYQLLLQGNTEALKKEAHYKPIKYEKKEEKDKK
ncbi:hypothetical protein HYX14_04675 [Candidatus Woesearchaeota archaeon]|nr:hypothetical protein [Candidatus Woesearchaeota archaeon]